MRNPKVDAYIDQTEKWREETKELRALALGCGLTEELKWGKPCYMLGEANVVIIQGFKEYCALMFCKGALLKDRRGILKKPGESSQAARQIRFSSVAELRKLKPAIRAYVKEAMAAQRAGREVVFKQNPEPVPPELQDKLGRNPVFKAAFEALTPGRQRGYILYISGAKQSATRESRVQKCTPRILERRGLND
jgi:uncharacterized protein YdeI (YjbR/CyaY-like superfamily)